MEKLKYLVKPLHLTLYRPWDYPENFGIYSQLNRKSETWLFTFLNVYVSWIERGKIVILQLSLPTFRHFADQNWPNGEPHENGFWQFSNAKMSFLNTQGSKSKWKKIESFVWFSCLFLELWSLNCQKLCPFRNFLLMSAKTLRLLYQFTYMHLKVLISLFQKMVLVIMLWHRVQKILTFEVDGFQ